MYIKNTITMQQTELDSFLLLFEQQLGLEYRHVGLPFITRMENITLNIKRLTLSSELERELDNANQIVSAQKKALDTIASVINRGY